MSTSIALVAFMDLRLSSLSSHCHFVLIAYSSLSLHISFSPLMTMSFEFTSSRYVFFTFFPYLKVVRPLLILDMVFESLLKMS
ncbi:hypothetical protein AAG906_007759 [Vitis piasezkii]